MPAEKAQTEVARVTARVQEIPAPLRDRIAAAAYRATLEWQAKEKKGES